MRAIKKKKRGGARVAETLTSMLLPQPPGAFHARQQGLSRLYSGSPACRAHDLTSCRPVWVQDKVTGAMIVNVLVTRFLHNAAPAWFLSVRCPAPLHHNALLALYPPPFVANACRGSADWCPLTH